MNVSIDIHYTSCDNKILRRGSFPLKRKRPEEVAIEFWKWIKKEHPYECELEKVICNGNDITVSVKEYIDKAEKDIQNEE